MTDMPDSHPEVVLEAFLTATDAVEFVFVGQRGQPDRALSFPQMRERAAAAAERLRAAGLTPGGRVALSMPTSLALVQSMLGAWMAGGAFAVLPERTGAGRSTLATEKLRAVIDLLRPAVLVADDLGTAAAACAAAAGVRVLRAADLLEAPPAPRLHWPAPDDHAFFQLTSGSTGTPKVVPVKFSQLTANLAGIARRGAIGREDRIACWIPLYHDMGLVSGLLQALYSGIPICLIPTALFIRSPLTWLQKASEYRATVSMGPSFAFQLFGRRNRAAQGRDLDLSRLRCLWMGAEPIDIETIAAFEDGLAPLGLRPGAVKACYGLAESVLAVACTGAAAPSRATWIDEETFRRDDRVHRVEPGTPGGLAVASCGTPLEGIAVEIVDAQGRVLPEHRVGRIVIRGASVMSGYLGDTPVPTAGFDTGDLGFLSDGEVHITGRLKDVIIRGGVNIGSHEVESQVESLLGLRSGKVVAFSLTDPRVRRERVVVGVEWRGNGDHAALRRSVREHVADHLSLQVDEVVLLGPGSIPRTTSGKIQRARARDLYREGALDLATPDHASPDHASPDHATPDHASTPASVTPA
jgi:acyl-CoA synthetase (AMP-forming)/AMP-acid ligase II